MDEWMDSTGMDKGADNLLTESFPVHEHLSPLLLSNKLYCWVSRPVERRLWCGAGSRAYSTLVSSTRAKFNYGESLKLGCLGS